MFFSKGLFARGDLRLLTAVIVITWFLIVSPLSIFAQEEDQDSGYQKATFAGGCFWCMEPPFDKLEGVISTTSGYAVSRLPNPTYKQVSSGVTGHAEVVQIVYDPKRISYQELLEVFWRNVDPLDSGGQFCDRGDQYRTAVFYHDEQHRLAAVQSKAALERLGGCPDRLSPRSWH